MGSSTPAPTTAAVDSGSTARFDSIGARAPTAPARTTAVSTTPNMYGRMPYNGGLAGGYSPTLPSLNPAAPTVPANPTVPENPAWKRWDGTTAPVPTPSASGINASKPQRTAAPDVTDKTLITPGIRLSDPNQTVETRNPHPPTRSETKRPSPSPQTKASQSYRGMQGPGEPKRPLSSAPEHHAPVLSEEAQASNDRLVSAMTKTRDPSGLIEFMVAAKQRSPDQFAVEYADILDRYQKALPDSQQDQYHAFKSKADAALGYHKSQGDRSWVAGALHEPLWTALEREDVHQATLRRKENRSLSQEERNRRVEAKPKDGTWDLIKEAATEGPSDLVIDDNAPLGINALREAFPDLPESPTRNDFYKAMQTLKPGETVLENSRRYELSDALIHNTPGAIPSNFAKAASEVTSWNAVGAVDFDWMGEETMVASRDAQDYLTFVNKNLAPYNHEVFTNLQKGIEPKGLEGLRGVKLDEKLVEREQRLVSILGYRYFKDHPDLDREAIMKEVSSMTTEPLPPWISAIGDPRNDYVQAATTDLFSTQDFNADNEADRVKIGHDIVRQIYRKRSNE